MWARLCGGLAFFVQIRYGTGTGILDPARTSLFTDYAGKAVVFVSRVYGLPVSYVRQKIELGLTEANNQTLTEVGIASGISSWHLITHATIRDMNGNPISILKTSVDILTIYATVYITLDNSHPSIQIVNPVGYD